MTVPADTGRIRLLAVVRWPVGGIRTYMRYTYGAFPGETELTILANRTQEEDLLRQDAAELGARLVPVEGGTRELAKAAWRELRGGGHTVVQSHGFNAAAAVSLANAFRPRPHLLTVHGILEQRLLTGFSGRLKRLGLRRLVRRLDAVHAVGRDIMEHLREEIPGLEESGVRCEIIPNGVDTSRFLGCRDTAPGLRAELGLRRDEFLFGFLGRLMEQKGFDLVIRAAKELAGEGRAFRVLVAASGDYIREYRRLITEAGLADRFVFLPYQDDVRRVFATVDAVLMPSRWEAWGLLKAEALSSGTPLVASTCMGLAEDIEDSPTLFVRPGDAPDLARAMRLALDDPDLARRFAEFAPEASRRFSVCRSAERMRSLLGELHHNGAGRVPAGPMGAVEP
ncbi:glycosyltransferase family 4 protein [Desulfohalovibrio reitneri]|uniref:glycosyltransferase family 4 protein n=1 Tax=Desulfohalovibrio reitneri TaxID=1307759 RepID=UPI0004A75C2A|nr:glycosyltransferase family 4 protein [Desulfohalovibrio reitneri]